MKTLQVDFPLWFRLRPFTYTAIIAGFCMALWLLASPDMFWGVVTIVGIVAAVLPIFEPFIDTFYTGPLQMDETRIRRESLAGCYEMRWDEVERIERPIKGKRWLVFYGKDKHLAVYGPDLWSGRDTDAMLALVEEQIEKRAILVEPKRNGDWQSTSNTKVSRKNKTVKAHL